MDAYRDQYATLFRNGQNVTLLGISVDAAPDLASWAHDRGYPFGFLSDTGGVMGRRYGAYDERYRTDNRTLYVIGPDGRVAYVAAPFREIDPAAYEELEAAIDSVTP